MLRCRSRTVNHQSIILQSPTNQQSPIEDQQSTSVDLLQVGIGAADELEVESVRILHEHVADRVAPLDQLAIARQDAPASRLVLGEELAYVANAECHA